MSNPINVVRPRSILSQERDPFPAEINGIVFSLLDTHSTLNLFYISRGVTAGLGNIKEIWKRRVEQEQQEDGACLTEGFHSRLVKAFRSQGFSLWRLPVVNLGNRCRNEENYVNFLTLKEMRYSAVRFKGVHGHVGIALSVKGHAEGSIKIRPANVPIKDIKGVVTVFKCLHKPFWTYDDSQGGFGITAVYSAFHRLDHTPSVPALCLTCPPLFQIEGALSWVPAIIANQDPVFRLTSDIIMEKNSPPFPQPLPPPISLPPPPLTPLQKLIKKLSTPLASLLSAIVASISFLVSCCRRR